MPQRPPPVRFDLGPPPDCVLEMVEWIHQNWTEKQSQIELYMAQAEATAAAVIEAGLAGTSAQDDAQLQQSSEFDGNFGDVDEFFRNHLEEELPNNPPNLKETLVPLIPPKHSSAEENDGAEIFHSVKIEQPIDEKKASLLVLDDFSKCH